MDRAPLPALRFLRLMLLALLLRDLFHVEQIGAVSDREKSWGATMPHISVTP
jgi:hypothetical protein